MLYTRSCRNSSAAQFALLERVTRVSLRGAESVTRGSRQVCIGWNSQPIGLPHLSAPAAACAATQSPLPEQISSLITAGSIAGIYLRNSKQ